MQHTTTSWAIMRNVTRTYNGPAADSYKVLSIMGMLDSGCPPYRLLHYLSPSPLIRAGA